MLYFFTFVDALLFRSIFRNLSIIEDGALKKQLKKQLINRSNLSLYPHEVEGNRFLRQCKDRKIWTPNWRTNLGWDVKIESVHEMVSACKYVCS